MRCSKHLDVRNRVAAPQSTELDMKPKSYRAITTPGPRPRTAPVWKAGLRRGRERNETTLLLQRSPLMQERLRNAHEQLRAWGVVPEWPHVKQPFDYVRR